jgi:hypothetical protein
MASAINLRQKQPKVRGLRIHSVSFEKIFQDSVAPGGGTSRIAGARGASLCVRKYNSALDG